MRTKRLIVVLGLCMGGHTLAESRQIGPGDSQETARTAGSTTAERTRPAELKAPVKNEIDAIGVRNTDLSPRKSRSFLGAKKGNNSPAGLASSKVLPAGTPNALRPVQKGSSTANEPNRSNTPGRTAVAGFKLQSGLPTSAEHVRAPAVGAIGGNLSTLNNGGALNGNSFKHRP